MLVGVVRSIEIPVLSRYRCPHARGGGPFEMCIILDALKSCPHARGGGPPEKV